MLSLGAMSFAVDLTESVLIAAGLAVVGRGPIRLAFARIPRAWPHGRGAMERMPPVAVPGGESRLFGREAR